MNKDANWYGLNMLPLYVEMSEGQLEASCEQLKNLQMAQEKPHVLDDETVARIIKLHRSQNADNWVFFEQCKKWRNANPTDEELKGIAQVEKNANQLETVNNEILTLADSFQGKTIDSILGKGDFELGLEYLLNQLSKNT
ncbi:TPA: hypothetical protein U2K00_003049 [Legionella pneumophila]|nr:hypothetical protein [Legionella pneumophila]